MARAEFVRWTSDLDTGIEIIDQQHRRLMEYLNELLSTHNGNDRAAITRVLDGLVDYTERHFAFEIELLEASEYEYTAGHRRAHDLFIRNLQGHIRRFKSGEDVAGDLAVMLRQWLIRHIKIEDGDYKLPVRRHLERINGSTGWLRRSLKRIFG